MPAPIFPLLVGALGAAVLFLLGEDEEAPAPGVPLPPPPPPPPGELPEVEPGIEPEPIDYGPEHPCNLVPITAPDWVFSFCEQAMLPGQDAASAEALADAIATAGYPEVADAIRWQAGYGPAPEGGFGEPWQVPGQEYG